MPFESDAQAVAPGSDGAIRIEGQVFDGAGEPVPGLRFTVETLRAPTVAAIEALIFGGPTIAPTPGAEQRRIVVTDHDRLVHAPLREARPCERATGAVLGLRVEEATVLDRPTGP